VPPRLIFRFAHDFEPVIGNADCEWALHVIRPAIMHQP